jgi:hypothetical protein
MHLIPVQLLGDVVVATDSAGLLINLLIDALIFSLAFWVIGKMGLPEPIGMILRAIVGVIALIWLLNLFGAMGGHPFVLYHR